MRDPWCDKIERLLDGRQGKISNFQLWLWLGFADVVGHQRQSDGKRLVIAMDELGWKKIKTTFAGSKHPQWGYCSGSLGGSGKEVVEETAF